MKSFMVVVCVFLLAGTASAQCSQSVCVAQQATYHAQQIQVQHVQQQRVQRIVVVEQPVVQQIVVQRQQAQQVQHVQAARQQVVVQQVVQQQRVQRVRQNEVAGGEVRQRGLINISRGGGNVNQSGFLGLPSLINVSR